MDDELLMLTDQESLDFVLPDGEEVEESVSQEEQLDQLLSESDEIEDYSLPELEQNEQKINEEASFYKGDMGKSSYQSYVDTTTDEPILSEVEWIESLKGNPFTYSDFTPEQLEDIRKPALDAAAVAYAALATYNLEFCRAAGNSYMEYSIDENNNILSVDYWTDSTKTNKLFTKTITYIATNPTQIVVKDEVTNKTLTISIAYNGSIITDVTKIIS